ncbi:MAG: isoprenylcysteine carboxylmethyltransferase family protein [Thermoanaerobaculia bacterium]
MLEQPTLLPLSWQRRLPILVGGWLCYALAVRSLLYLMGFLANRGVAKTVDSAAAGPALPALALDFGWLMVFVLPHSWLASERMKRWLGERLPAWAETSGYGLVSALSLVLLMWQWRPVPEPIWRAEGSARWLLEGLFFAGWLLALAASWTLGHFRLFGLAPVLAHVRGRPAPPPALCRHGLYARLRHPMYLGFLLALWAAPTFSLGRALFASTLSLYIAVGIRLEEAKLAERFGGEYRAYRRAVPALLPRWRPLLRGRQPEPLQQSGPPGSAADG